MGPFRTIPDHGVPILNITDHAGPYGTIQNPMGPNKSKGTTHVTLTKETWFKVPYKAM